MAFGRYSLTIRHNFDNATAALWLDSTQQSVGSPERINTLGGGRREEEGGGGRGGEEEEGERERATHPL